MEVMVGREEVVSTAQQHLPAQACEMEMSTGPSAVDWVEFRAGGGHYIFLFLHYKHIEIEIWKAFLG